MPRTTLPLLTGLLFLALSPTLFVAEAAAQAVSADAVDAIFAEWDTPDSPGCALAVIHEGEIVYKNGYGMASLEHSVPITPQTVFYSGSVSKQFVALSIALLAEQGKLSFDDDIHTYLPEIPEYDRPITIRHMIHHTSGLRDYLQLSFLAGRDYLDAMSEEEVLGLIARQKELNFSPGDQYLYSNSGYFLLAEIVKRVSGRTLRQFADAHMLGPLGMKDSHFHDDNTMVVPNRADGYFKKDDGWGAMTMRFALVGSGGLYTTVEDLFRWDQNFYHNTLGAGTQNLIETTLTRGILASGDTLGYAFALGIGAYRGVKTVGHSGSLGGYRADLKRFPEQQFATAILCNLTAVDPGTLANRVADLYLAEVLEPEEPGEPEAAAPPGERKEVTVDPALYDDYAGRYELTAQPGLVITITHEDGHLMGEATGQPKVELFPESETRFFLKVADIQITFERNDAGYVDQLTVYQNGQQMPAQRLSDTRPEALADYAGAYYSDELQVTYTIALDDGTLALRIGSRPSSRLSVTQQDQATAEVGTMAFERDAGGAVTGFVLQSGRVRNMRFGKRPSSMAAGEAVPQQGWEGINNLFRDGLYYFGGQPDEAALKRLAEDAGITTVVNLRRPQELEQLDFDEPAVVEALGMRYVNIPITPDAFSKADVDRFAAVLAESKGPVLLHCGSANRAGGMWAGYLTLHRGLSLEEALRLGKTAGLRRDTMIEAVQQLQPQMDADERR